MSPRVAALCVILAALPAAALARPDFTTDANLVTAGYAARDSGDLATAAQDFTSAATAGNAQGQIALSGMYLTGQGKPQNCQQARHWMGQSAMQGDFQAIYNIGFYYEQGICVPQNYAAALMLYKAAATAGWVEAQNNVGTMYDHAEGVPRDDAEAIRWFTMAANQNNASGQLNLGLLAQAGLGEKRDLVTADKWMELAVKYAADAQFKEIAETKLTGLQASMTAQQIAQGHAQAAAWTATATPQTIP